MNHIKNGQICLVVWMQNVNPQNLKTIVEELKVKTGHNVAVENSEMLKTSKHKTSSFDVCILKLGLDSIDIPMNVLAEILRIIKPLANLIISDISSENLRSLLKLAGFINIDSDTEEVVMVASKPDFEIGSQMKLSFANGEKLIENNSNFKKWTIDLDDPDVELEDPDDLLSEEDKIKPDPASLKVCGTTGKRKACKNCVCGLQEELDAETETKVIENKKDFKSSCGSCYLGDAFRCASCPYIGMPAFKPGEKVKFTDATLRDAV